MHNGNRRVGSLLPVSVLFVGCLPANAQAATEFGQSGEVARANSYSPSYNVSEQTAHILGLDSLTKEIASMQAQRPCTAPTSLEELATRQELSESIQSNLLDVDAVLAEIANEQGQLSNLQTSLQMRRDKTVARLNTAALITGSGAGAAISATQFTSLGDRTNNIGDGFGVGAGVVSTIFAIIAARKQDGPSGTVGEIPNMLAPLFDEHPVLNTYYPPAVLHYLQTIPASKDAGRGTRLEQLKAMWVNSGRIASDPSRRQRNILAVTSSLNPEVKVSIQDLSARIAMLVDVSGRTSLMKRDLSTIMRSYATTPPRCLNKDALVNLTGEAANEAKSKASTQDAKDNQGASPLVEIVNEPAATLIVDAPLAEPLAGGRVYIRYRTENLRVMPVFGTGALKVSPRLGHIHITVDDSPWHFVDASGETIILVGLLPGPHKVLIELADPTHRVLTSATVEFIMSPTSTKNPR